MNTINTVLIKKIELKNFRCFEKKIVTFDYPVTLLYGNNGTGKTSIVEALYYTCYLRSFKNYSPKDLIRFNENGFFIKIDLNESDSINTIQIGFSPEKRLITINKKKIISYKELINYYRIVCLTEDDLQIIKEGPDTRRLFMDQALLMLSPEYIGLIKEFRAILEQRNSFLLRGHIQKDSYDLWTQQLWEKSVLIQKERISLLQKIEHEIIILSNTFFQGELNITLPYRSRKIGTEASFDLFLQNNQNLYSDEIKYKRSLFGIHLDDFLINFQEKKSRNFSSRGQQKLLVLLIKTAQIILLQKQGAVVFLLDDFITDLDHDKTTLLLKMLYGLHTQLIFTSPLQKGLLYDILSSLGAQLISIEE